MALRKIMKSIRISRYKSGFTIVELLITLIIFTFVIGMIYATYSMGIFMWKTTETKIWTVQEARMSLERIIREARGARKESVVILKDVSGAVIGFKFTSQGSSTSREVSFEKSGDKILRKVANAGNNIIATNVKDFLVEPVGSSYKVAIIFKNEYTVSGTFTPRNPK